MLRLLLLFTLVPAIELILLLKVHHFFAQSYGFGTGLFVTVGTILATGVVGANLARQQGLSVLRRLQSNLNQGQPPTDEMIDGVMIFSGGALLLTPGFLTDAFGFLLLLPFTRAPIRERIKAAILRSIASGRVVVYGSGFHAGGAPDRGYGSKKHRPGEVIDIEAKDVPPHS